MTFKTIALSTACLLLLTCIGCKPSASAVSGRVTCDGKPLEDGSIMFQPADGHGPSAGGAIVRGQYRLPIVPGAKKVQIVGIRLVPVDKNNPVASRLAQGAAQRGDKSGTYRCIDPTVVGAEGNNAVVEVKLGNQTIDFALKRHADKK